MGYKSEKKHIHIGNSNPTITINLFHHIIIFETQTIPVMENDRREMQVVEYVDLRTARKKNKRGKYMLVSTTLGFQVKLWFSSGDDDTKILGEDQRE